MPKEKKPDKVSCPNCGSSFIYTRIDKTIVCRKCGETNQAHNKGHK